MMCIHFDSQSVKDGGEILKPESVYAIIDLNFLLNPNQKILIFLNLDLNLNFSYFPFFF